MGCKLVRGETIYFIRHGGPNPGKVEPEWFGEEWDTPLLPRVYTRSDGHAAAAVSSVVPVEIRTFEAS